tara:strand:+ start:1691 stop:1948 length:258 start_codon:yes stop_codon:yes gene_type:complete
MKERVDMSRHFLEEVVYQITVITLDETEYTSIEMTTHTGSKEAFKYTIINDNAGNYIQVNMGDAGTFMIPQHQVKSARVIVRGKE